MAENIFVAAKDYRKKHPRTSFQEAIQIVSKKRKPVKKARAAVGAVKAKKKPVKVKVTKTRKGGVSMSISGISISEITRQQNYLKSLEKVKEGTENMLRDKTKKADHAFLRRQLVKTKDQIAQVRRHIIYLKKGI